MQLSDNSRGILAMVAAVGFFSLMDALMKLLAASYPPMQVAAMRGMASLPLVCCYVLWQRETASLLWVRWPLHLMRGIMGVVMLSLFAYGLQTLTLTDAYAISFIAPLLITLLAIPFLNEKATPTHWLCLCGGLVGVWIAMKPSGAVMFSTGALAILGASVCYAASAVTGRVLSRTDTSSSLVFWMTLLMAAGAGALAAPDWQTLSPDHWPLIIGLGVTGFLGQLTITQAFRYGQAATVAPFEYSALMWGAGLDWMLWQTLPFGRTLLGAAIIIACGVYLIRAIHKPAPKLQT
jgi:drug/metabolite transporter (DMT)-like permease